MSSRALRRLERQKEQQALAERDTKEATDEPSIINLTPASKPLFNAFALLGEDNEGEDEHSDDDHSTDIDSAVHKDNHRDSPKQDTKSVPVSTSTNRQKSKKKKVSTPILETEDDFDRILEEAKRKNMEKGNSSKREIEGDDSSKTDAADEYDFEEEFDMEMKAVPEYDSNYKYFTTNRLKQSLPLLSVNSIKHLDPDMEFRNLFGNLSLDVIQDANTTSSFGVSPEYLAQLKKLARSTRGWGGKDRRSIPGTTRKLLLTRIRDDWLPTTNRDLSMEEISSDILPNFFTYMTTSMEYPDLETKLARERALGIRYFRFKKSLSVQDRISNTKFYAAVVMTPDPDTLMKMLSQHPYHAETLLQVAMVLLRQGENKSTSNSLVERALFVFDRAFHKVFHELFSRGKTELLRLPYEDYANRQFYLCVFRIIVGLGERRTFSTALSYCKLLLSLSPAQDPVGVRYFIDHYAIMSESFSWLIKFAESPLCTTYKMWFTPGIAFSVVYAYLELGDHQKAKAAVTSAAEAHPYAAAKLSDLLGAPIHFEISPSLETKLAAETYLVRAGSMWSDPAKSKVLIDELTRYFRDKDSRSYAESSTGPGSFLSSIRGIFGKKTEDASLSMIPHNLIRFAILSGENKILSKLPEKFWNRDDLLEYDVLPPQDETTDYNEHTGISIFGEGVVTSLIQYVDHHLLGAIVQNSTAGMNELDDLIDEVRQMEQQENNDQ